MMETTEILIVEDDPLIRHVLKIMLRKLGYSICGTAESGEEAIMQVVATNPDLVLMDIGLNGVCDGIIAATHIFEFFSIPVVFSTGHSGGEFIERAKAARPFGYLTKPFNDRELYSTIEIALNSYEMYIDRFGKKGRKLHELLHLDEGLLFLDTDGRIIFSNPYAEHLISLSHQDAFFRYIGEVIDYEPAASMVGEQLTLWDRIRESIAIGTGHDMIIRISGGKKRMVHMSVISRKNCRGTTIGYIIRLEQKFGEYRPLSRRAQAS